MDKEFLEIVGNGSSTGSVLVETNVVSVTISINVQKMTQPNSCSRMREMRREPEVPEARVPVVSCKDYLKGTCTNSFCNKWHPPECLFYKTKSGCTFWEKCSYAHRQVSKRSKTNDDKSAVAMLKKNDLHESIRQPVVYCDESHERLGQPAVKRDTRHELKHRLVGRRSSNTRQSGCVFQDVNNCAHSLVVLVLCIFSTCRACRPLEVFLSRCPFCQVFLCTRVCLPQGPLSLCLDVIRCTLCSEDCPATVILTTVTDITSTVGSGATVSTIREKLRWSSVVKMTRRTLLGHIRLVAVFSNNNKSG